MPGRFAAAKQAGATDDELSETLMYAMRGRARAAWSTIKYIPEIEDINKDLGITVRYSESNNDPKRQSQLIDTAVAQKVKGLAVSAPNPSALKSSLARAKR